MTYGHPLSTVARLHSWLFFHDVKPVCLYLCCLADYCSHMYTWNCFQPRNAGWYLPVCENKSPNVQIQGGRDMTYSTGMIAESANRPKIHPTEGRGRQGEGRKSHHFFPHILLDYSRVEFRSEVHADIIFSSETFSIRRLTICAVLIVYDMQVA